MHSRGNANLAALGLAIVFGLGALMGLSHESHAKSPSAGWAPIAVASPVPPVKARPAPLPNPIQPRSGKIGTSNEPKSQGPSMRSPNVRVPYATCRSSCATSCYNTTPCNDLTVAQCTSARQRCRLTCNSSCY